MSSRLGVCDSLGHTQPHTLWSIISLKPHTYEHEQSELDRHCKPSNGGYIRYMYICLYVWCVAKLRFAHSTFATESPASLCILQYSLLIDRKHTTKTIALQVCLFIYPARETATRSSWRARRDAKKTTSKTTTTTSSLTRRIVGCWVVCRCCFSFTVVYHTVSLSQSEQQSVSTHVAEITARSRDYMHASVSTVHHKKWRMCKFYFQCRPGSARRTRMDTHTHTQSRRGAEKCDETQTRAAAVVMVNVTSKTLHTCMRRVICIICSTSKLWRRCFCCFFV